ncbi:argininosuccinate synthase [Candidatus Oleimmundimicrobium sp.]|uniref:argininosuccinate synthase n=1 Tax=Candidatus Oleimmundimicrobium sp. TaxID=3060597 RepID=UPI0027237B23|nr:argininosuccinate synthase [Candidatus Oleimmundimicrobium sp.]MDO8886117.1 argininosuccinate synthase [Candidatus Oleimmundimicrobium sp.]
MSKRKVVLAYSGGLDTSVAIKWLQEKYDLEVITLALDVGQPIDLDAIKQKALIIGAKESHVIEAKKEFAQDFIFPALKANAIYEGKYPLPTALARPLIAKHLVEVAKKSGADLVAHGSTGKGNDQVRFEVSIASLEPSIKVIAPIREWTMSRDESMRYAEKHGIPVSTTKKSPYSVDENLWGRSCECGILEDPGKEPPEDAYSWTKSPLEAPDEPECLEISFIKGSPVELNGKQMSLVSLIEELNKTGGKHGIGRIDMIENRLVGIKSREIYECPAATILIQAHKELEALTLERDLSHFKELLGLKYAELVYYGQWFSPLREALDSFFEKTQEPVSGKIRMKLYKGSSNVVGRESKESLYDLSLATYETADSFSHESAKGFIELFGLPLKVWAKRQRKS